MKTSVSFSQFCDAFYNTGRKDQFSYGAKRALFDYLEELADDIGTEYELDVIALCCEYAESDVEEIIADYGIDVEGAEGDEEEIESIVECYLQDNTCLVGKVGGSFLFAQF